MKGIITKDLLGLKQLGLTMGVLMVFYLALGFMNMKDGGITYFSIMALVINVMVPLSCAGYDEQCGWDPFGAALPVSRNKIVACRYIVGLIVMGFTMAVVLAANLIFMAFGGETTGILGYLVPILITLFYIAIMTPIIYKFGVQKSRFIIIAVMILPALLLAALAMFMTDETSEEPTIVVTAMESLSEVPVLPAVIVMTFLAAAVYVLSMILSMRIYSKKEL